ncbi:SusC/RagA family TonB-linked outer membrane protein [Echinicola strongylocentroti]|uniref:SusC/RagA family TonB-linked outer membrane protein n=1 Tax=Echinicola strongylocentroti TaxID=1795355 RepID=A0A2Z4IE37_9BACT|nr:TonB-dependent receptor [Echinicola strongylocentroti]AWW29095.1 SusC/RagA family TonB-linked outer membrane protein [Echinicola strongylocentroti]
MKKRKLLLIALLISYASASWAQTKVSGVVTDEEKVPIPGVNILVKGTSTGAVTDVEGHYSLEVPGQNTVLVFSSIGYKSQEVTVGTKSLINLSMEPDISSLGEVVVIGYGEIEKKDATGAIGSVESEDIVRANPVQAAKAIQGQAAGVTVSKQNSRPGAGYNINIRGLSSINYSNEPLVVIDGVMGGDLNALNPADIESMDILKDASSTAIYGSRGANGVIIISTKRGVKGKPVVSYDGYVGVKTPAHLPDMMNAQQFYKASVTDRELNGYPQGRPFSSTEIDMVDSGNSTNWLDEISGPALQTNHSLSVGGGSDNTNYHFSGGYLNEGGALQHTKFQRYNIKGSMDSKLTKFLRVGFTANYSVAKKDLGSNEALRSAYRARPTGVALYDDILNPDENQDFAWNGYAAWMGINDKQVLNPLIEIDPENFQDETRSDNFFGNAYVELMPVEGLSVKSSLSASVSNSRWGQFRGTMTKDRKTSLLPRAFRQTDDISNYTLDNIITYKKEMGHHDVTVTGVQSIFHQRNEEMDSYADEIPYNSLWYALGTGRPVELNTRLTERSLLSYMGRVMYGFKDKYLLTLTGRWDGASQLSEENKWDFFPSAAIAWRLGDEEFIRNMSAVSDLKLRVSYGYVGNSSVAPYSTQARLIKTPYDFDGSPAFGFAPENLTDKSLGWEKSKEWNIGINVGFFNNRISGVFELYHRNTVDLIYNEQIPTSSGFSSVTTNVGEVANKGVELTLNTVNIANSKFTWSTSINFAKNVNEVVSIGSEGIMADIATGLFVGQPLRAHYAYEFAGIWQLDEEAAAAEYGQVPGSVKVVDQNDDGTISTNEGMDDRTIIGSEQPDWTMGMTNKFSYGNFDLSFLIYTSQGAIYRNNMLSGTMGQIGAGRYNTLNLNYWTVNNPTNDYYGPGVPNPHGGAIFYQDASFVRISDITFGYTLPRAALDKIGFTKFRMYAQVSNPFVFYDFDGMDPEFNSSTYNDGIPTATYLFGLNVSF